MTAQTGDRRKRSPYGEWTKAAFITAVVMGALCILLFKAPSLFGNNDAVVFGFFLALEFPGAIIIVPAILANAFLTNIHDTWPGWLVIGAVLNWLFYAQLVYFFIRFRRRKREAGLPPLEGEVFDYSSRWQKPTR